MQKAPLGSTVTLQASPYAQKNCSSGFVLFNSLHDASSDCVTWPTAKMNLAELCKPLSKSCGPAYRTYRPPTRHPARPVRRVFREVFSTCHPRTSNQLAFCCYHHRKRKHCDKRCQPRGANLDCITSVACQATRLPTLLLRTSTSRIQAL